MCRVFLSPLHLFMCGINCKGILWRCWLWFLGTLRMSWVELSCVWGEEMEAVRKQPGDSLPLFLLTILGVIQRPTHCGLLPAGRGEFLKLDLKISALSLYYHSHPTSPTQPQKPVVADLEDYYFYFRNCLLSFLKQQARWICNFLFFFFLRINQDICFWFIRKSLSSLWKLPSEQMSLYFWACWS